MKLNGMCRNPLLAEESFETGQYDACLLYTPEASHFESQSPISRGKF